MITKEQALKLRHGDTIFEIGSFNADGTATRWRVSGNCKLWKTRPNEFKIPLKHGLYSNGYLTHDTARFLSIEEPNKKPKRKKCCVCREIFQPIGEGETAHTCRPCILALRKNDGLMVIVIQDRPNGERLYWSNDNGWCGDRESAEEFRERPISIPVACDAQVFQYKITKESV